MGIWRASLSRTSTLLRIYLVGGLVLLLVGFVLYTQAILRHMEEDNRQLIQPLARLSAYVASVADRETSRLIREVIGGIATYGRIRFVITDESGRPLIARGLGDPQLEAKVQEGRPLTSEEQHQLHNLLQHMDRAEQEPLPVEFVERDRRIIGRIYYGDVDPEALGEIPLVLADVTGRPLAWRIQADWETPATHPENRDRAEALIQEATRFQRVADLQINPPLRRGRFYYELRPIRALQWMPYVQIGLIALFTLGGASLYRRVRLEEQAAVWAGLAKESAHQLGTPISSLLGWLDLARERHPEPSSLGDVSLYEAMEEDLQRLRRVVQRFAQVGTTPTMRPVDVNQVVHEAVAYFRSRLPSRSVAVEILEQSDPSVPLVWGNEELLQWVVENLIRNALDAIEQKGSSSRERVTVSTGSEGEGKYVTITVQDTGGGIPRSIRGRLFDAGVTTKRHGWGVGLALARRIVEQYHRGRIGVLETGPEGTTFFVRIPTASARRRNNSSKGDQ
ncbi:MAG: hypothetical protein KatS3mg115_2067 [Candidatus Poribacteria bacterium]|nr:MAG: hypothetical protein KatS3mg115_2067 [Candidatus Poribacteria bacterium]